VLLQVETLVRNSRLLLVQPNFEMKMEMSMLPLQMKLYMTIMKNKLSQILSIHQALANPQNGIESDPLSNLPLWKHHLGFIPNHVVDKTLSATMQMVDTVEAETREHMRDHLVSCMTTRTESTSQK
jgi:hypothetical protein